MLDKVYMDIRNNYCVFIYDDGRRFKLTSCGNSSIIDLYYDFITPSNNVVDLKSYILCNEDTLVLDLDDVA